MSKLCKVCPQVLGRIFSGTAMKDIQKQIVGGVLNKKEHSKIFFTNLSVSDRSDTHNLRVKNYISRIDSSLDSGKLQELNGGEPFDPSDLLSSDEKAIAKAVLVMSKAIDLVNRVCDQCLELNINAGICKRGVEGLLGEFTTITGTVLATIQRRSTSFGSCRHLGFCILLRYL